MPPRSAAMRASKAAALRKRLAALEKHRHHDAVEQVFAQIASGDEIRIQQRMLGSAR